MILLKISNSSELIASKLGNFIEKLTPDSLDDSAVEELIVTKMIQSLSEEGVKGEVVITRGMEVRENRLLLDEGFKVKSNKCF